jgi:Lysozyme inhibitor LprI
VSRLKGSRAGIDARSIYLLCNFLMRLLGAVPFYVLLFGLAASATAVQWPANFVLHSGTASPDGRYGILVPPHDSAESEDRGDCYLVEIPSHRVLGALEAVDYFENQNHADLSTVWSADSVRCILTRGGRFGFDRVLLLELHDQGFRQVNLGTTIQQSLDAVIAKEATKDHLDSAGPANAYVRFAKDTRIRFRALSNSNPKSLDEVPTYCALFQGTYDPSTDRWTVADARPIAWKMFDTLSTAYENGGEATQFPSEQAKAEAYDRQLNGIYSAVRFILPKTEFEKVKAAQLAWLKERDAAPSLEEKNRRVLVRVKALEDLLW